MEHCPDHISLCENIVQIKERVIAIDNRINGSLDTMESHQRQGNSWRMAIVGNVIMIVMQLVGFAYLWGQASKQIEINTNRLDIIEKVSYGYQDTLRGEHK